MHKCLHADSAERGNVLQNGETFVTDITKRSLHSSGSFGHFTNARTKHHSSGQYPIIGLDLLPVTLLFCSVSIK